MVLEPRLEYQHDAHLYLLHLLERHRRRRMAALNELVEQLVGRRVRRVGRQKDVADIELCIDRNATR